MVMAKDNFDYDFSSWCNLHLNLEKSFPDSPGRSWEAGNYHDIVFWSVTSKAEFNSERRLVPSLLPKENFRESFGLPKIKVGSLSHNFRSPESLTDQSINY